MAAAIFSGYTALLFKCIAEIIASAGLGRNPFHCWQVYVILAVALSCAPTELHFLNLALQLGDAIFVVPVYLALGMVSQLLTGMIFFEEYKDFVSASHAIEFAISVSITLLFVMIMAKANVVVDEFALEEPEMFEKLDILQEDSEMTRQITDPATPSKQHSASKSKTPSLVLPLPKTPKMGLTMLDEEDAADAVQVTVAGFGGAIEVMEIIRQGSSCSNRLGRGQSPTSASNRGRSMSPTTKKEVGIV